MEQIENIRKQVQEYFDKNARYCMPTLELIDEDDKSHIINTGTSIICTRHEVGYPGGSFVRAIVNNDLRATFANADAVNTLAVKFYLTMMYNMGVKLI
jgi:hypothetical protein